MKITMLQTRRGCEADFALKRFYKGETYDIGESLARSFLAKGWAYNSEPESLFEELIGIVADYDGSRS